MMLRSFSEFKFYQSFRIPVEKSDNLRFLVQRDNEAGKPIYIEDGELKDISLTGFGFATKERISVGTELNISLQFKRSQLDLVGRVVRAFSDVVGEDSIIYGVELDEDPKVKKFLQQYILSFSQDRLKECLVDSALKEKYNKPSDGFEMFSLLLSLFKDITQFGDKEGFIDNMVEEVVRILNAQRASIFLINPDTNELEAIAALGVNKEQLKFDYRLGIAGSVFTTGVALNIDVENDSTRFNEEFDEKFGFHTKSILCYPIHNREDKTIGVIEIINKRNQDRFTVEDEKTMKVMALVFSSVFHRYNPMSEKSQIRRFSTPFDRKFAFIGKTPHATSLRSTIIKVKDIDAPVLIQGETGVGKTLYAQILHYEGQRGLNKIELIECNEKNNNTVLEKLFSSDPEVNSLILCKGGTLVLREVCQLSLENQRRLFSIISAQRLPDASKITIDVRIIATSSHVLSEMVDEGTFDKGLCEYLSKAYIYIEPLRRRGEDITALAEYFLKFECQEQGLLLKSFSPKAMEKLRAHDWFGNIQELRTCVQRAVLYNPKNHIITEMEMSNTASPLLNTDLKRKVFGGLPYVSDSDVPLKERLAIVEREMIMQEIKRHNGNKSKAAKSMAISREALRKKLLISNEVLETLEKQEAKRLSNMIEKKAA